MIKKIGLALAVLAQFATAEIYQWTDKDGHVHFSESLPKDLQNTKNLRKRDDRNLPGITTMDPQEFRERAPENYAQQVIETNNDADWPTCAETKRRAVRAEKNGWRAEELNEWLWKNCRTYSNDLRKIEQEMM